jgi:hypothetical protein
MRLTIRCLSWLVIAAASSAGQAQAKLDGQAHGNVIAPFVDEQTIGVVRVDLSRLDFDQLLKQAAELTPGGERILAPAVEHFRPMAKRLLDSGVEDVYVVVSLADLPQLPFLVLSAPDNAVAAELETWRAELHVEAIERIGKAVFAGSQRALQRVKSQPPAARPEIARAFSAAGDAAVQVLLLPTADNRRVIEELMPTLPSAVGGGSSKVLTRGAMWAAIGIDLRPRFALELVMQSQDRETAAALRDKWLAVLQLFEHDARIVSAVPQFKELAGLLAPTVKDDRLLLSIDVQGPVLGPLADLLKGSSQALQANARKRRLSGQMKQIGLALHNYHDVYGSFPASASYSAEGKPLLSWRVHILPFIEQMPLYKEFHLDEPWDSEHNRKLIERMPEVYRSKNWSPEQPTKTCFVGITSEGSVAASRKKAAPGAQQDKPAPATVFQGREGVKIQDIPDGTSNTIFVVESDAEHAVIWTKPEDLPFNHEQPTNGFGVDDEGRVSALFCDGSWRRLKATLDAETWRRLLLRNDGEPIPRD